VHTLSPLVSGVKGSAKGGVVRKAERKAPGGVCAAFGNAKWCVGALGCGVCAAFGNAKCRQTLAAVRQSSAPAHRVLAAVERRAIKHQAKSRRM